MKILVLFASLFTNLVFSYIGLWAGEKLVSRKKLTIQNRLLLFLFSIVAIAAALFTAFLFAPLAAIILFAAMFFGVQIITEFSVPKSARFALIYTVIVVVLSSLESYLVTVLLLTK